MTTTALSERSPDSDLWQLVCLGSVEAFEAIVRRHQSLVSAVAYNACGNLALSEDVAQETFWTAWKERMSLDQPNRLRPWLCGIARNLGKNAGRRAARPAESASALEAVNDLSTEEPGPSEEAVSREEESLVWQTLEQIPEAYREPLILFYREEQSVAEVATALELSEDAVKQRLSRGRGMLRERMAELVEVGLRRTRPGRKFTVAVMTGLTVGSAGAKSALAAGGAIGAGAGAGAAAATTAVAGGLLGAFAGLSGSWLGTWVPAQLAPTKSEREAILRAGRRILVVSILFLGGLLGLIALLGGRNSYVIAWGVWMVTFQAYIGYECFRLSRAVKQIRAEAGPTAEPNDTALRKRLTAMTFRYRGRVYRSRFSLLGFPLVDINVSDPMLPGEPGTPVSQDQGRRIARGWIAIGDDARGILLAIGSTARGFVAMGGRTIGVVSFGGVAVGVLAVGGAALGVLSLGGLGVGYFALGGLAIGWQACGGGAFGWDIACGGLGVAWHGAVGGAAYAHEYAIGGGGWAAHFNDAAAKAILQNHPLKRGMDWYVAHLNWVTLAIVLPALLLPMAQLPLMYRRERPKAAEGGNSPG